MAEMVILAFQDCQAETDQVEDPDFPELMGDLAVQVCYIA